MNLWWNKNRVERFPDAMGDSWDVRTVHISEIKKPRLVTRIYWFLQDRWWNILNGIDWLRGIKDEE